MTARHKADLRWLGWLLMAVSFAMVVGGIWWLALHV